MSSILVRISAEVLSQKIGLDMSLRGRPASVLDDPDTREGSIARATVAVMDKSPYAGLDHPPAWLHREFKWGPHSWPVSWASIFKMENIDCGVFQALSTYVYRERGIEAHALQLLLRFNPESTRGWSGLWTQAGLEAHWCSGRLAYHEATLLVDQARQGGIFDPMGPFFLQVKEHPGYEGVVALRLCPQKSAEPVCIAGCQVLPEEWYVVRGALSEALSI